MGLLPAQAEEPPSGRDGFRDKTAIAILQVLDSPKAFLGLIDWSARALRVSLDCGHVVAQALDTLSAANQTEPQTVKLLLCLACPSLDSQGMVFLEERVRDFWNGDTENIQELCKEHTSLAWANGAVPLVFIILFAISSAHFAGYLSPYKWPACDEFHLQQKGSPYPAGKEILVLANYLVDNLLNRSLDR